MGADLLGYWLHFEAKKGEKLIKERIKELKSVLSDPVSVKFMKGEETPRIKKLEEMGVYINDYQANIENELSEEDDDSKHEQMLIDHILEDLEALGDEPIAELEEVRDAAWHSLKINDATIQVIFTGELSYGDEPEGRGYAIIKILSYLGITQCTFDAINWGNKKKGK